MTGAGGAPVELRWPGGSGTSRLGSVPLGRGGEGAVWPLEANLAGVSGPVVAKLYHDPGAGDRAAKVAAMLEARPSSDAVCWPLAQVWLPAGPGTAATFAGYAMTALPGTAFRTWAQLAHAGDRRANAPLFSVRYALTACRNLTAAMAAIHQAGHLIGDVNESNVFVGTDATVRLVDADSAQVHATNGRVYPCLVGKAEFTAPELIGRTFGEQRRTQATDVFGFAVLVHQMLTGGAHPTDGVPSGAGEPPNVSSRIAQRWLPGLDPAHAGPLGPAPRIPTAAIPSRLRHLLIAAYAVRPDARPTLGQFDAALANIITHLQRCPAEPNHVFDPRDGGCGWCAHARSGRPDLWAAQRAAASAQQGLPPVPFLAPQVARTVRRSPAGTHGRGAGPVPSWATYAARAQAGAAQSAPMPAGQTYPSAGRGAGSGRSSAGRTMLVGADGIPHPRGSLFAVARHQPWLAAKCAWSELPETFKPRWPAPTTRPAPIGSLPSALWTVAAAILVLLVSVATAVGGPVGLNALSRALLSRPVPAVLSNVGLVGAGTAALACLMLACSRRRTLRAVGVPRRMSGRDLPRFAVIAALYGPGLLVVGVGAAVCLLLWLVAVLIGALLGRDQ